MSAYDAIPGLQTCNGEPVFSEPWEAQAFSLVVGLHERGHFDWQEWADVLSGVIAEASLDQPYYQSWLEALDLIVARKSLISEQEFFEREAAWKAALAVTPHGEPIELAAVKE